ncbi:MAG: prolyl-tRNA synthetase associated domain-containing protein [Saccharofermentanales bacterium]|jgi:Ala-tRNA(Pro) deacylase|nr:prolyl-tRNA synthetase associated domain-containing protein [Clostridiaceae bacterium]
MDKREIYKFLDLKGISYEITEHQAVFNMEQLADVDLPYPEDNSKNLFVRDKKKRKYYLITVKGDKRVDLKEFKNANGTRPLSFASSDDLRAIMKLEPGSVTPLGLLNDHERRVEFYLDQSFFEGNARIGCHPNDNTATVWFSSSDLLKMIQEHGSMVHIVDFIS